MAEAQRSDSQDRWQAKREAERGKLLYLPVKTQVTKEEIWWQEKAMDVCGTGAMVLAILLGILVFAVNIGRFLKWW